MHLVVVVHYWLLLLQLLLLPITTTTNYLLQVLSVDFVSDNAASPKEKGQYFGLSAAEVSANLGAPLHSESHRVLHLRTGLEANVRIWTPVRTYGMHHAM